MPDKKKIEQDTAPKGTVNVNKDSLDKLVRELEEEREARKKLEEKVDYVADKGRSQRFEDKNKKEELTKVRLTIYKGLIVTSWDNMPQNKVEKVNGVWVTEQTVKYHLEDGSTASMLYDETVYLPRIDAYIEAEKTTNDLDNDGNKIVLLDLITDDGKKLTVDRRFIN